MILCHSLSTCCHTKKKFCELSLAPGTFIVYSYKYQHDDGRVSYPLCFIFSSPVGKNVSGITFDCGFSLAIKNYEWCIIFTLLFSDQGKIYTFCFVFGRLQTRAADDVRRKQKQTGANC